MLVLPQSGNDALIFVDIERRRNRITQIAAVAVDNELNELESFDVRIRYGPPQRDSPQALVPRRAADRFAKFLRRYPSVNLVCDDGKNRPVARLVAHNAERFDAPILQHWYAELGLFLPAARLALCTKQRALWMFEEDKSLMKPVDAKLRTLCEYFGVKLSNEEAHDALHDVRATVAIYRAMRGISKESKKQAA